jgi:DNA-binding NarL/FixJ family response regulator
MTKKKIKVGLVDDDREFRETLAWHINLEPDLTVQCEFSSGNQFLSNVPFARSCDVVLMDIGLPDVSGIQCAATLKQSYPLVQIIMQTVYATDEKIFDSLKAGAVGYVLKKEPVEVICDAIRDAYTGGAPMSGFIARRVLDFFRQKPVADPLEVLTDREKEVMHYLVDGKSYKIIADKLEVSIHAVRFHLHNIYTKMHVASRSEAVAKVMSAGGRPGKQK